MKTILTVFKKELRRFFTDKRILLSLFLPGVLIYVIYSVLGGVITDMTTGDKTYTVYTVNEPTELEVFFDIEGYTVVKNELELTHDEILDKVKNNEVDLYVVYDENFFPDSLLENLENVPSVAIYYNSINEKSSALYSYITACFSAYETTLVNRFNVNENLNIKYDMATDEDLSVMVLGMVLPMILISFLFSGAMGICSESIAGEKERGTIATLLVTPVERSHLVVGKILALGLTTCVSAFVSFLGLILSLPKLVGTEFSLTTYGIDKILLLLLVVIITALLFTTLLTIVSTYAKSVKEATSLAGPAMILIMVVGMSGMMNGGAETNLLMYCIPIYNSIQCFTGLLNMQFDILAIIITVVMNVIVISLGVFAVTKMFNSEKIMFNK